MLHKTSFGRRPRAPGSSAARAMAMASLEEEDFADLRWCKKCGKKGYLRKGACVNSGCAGFSTFPGALVLDWDAS